MFSKDRHFKFYELFKQNGWNGLLNVNGSPVCLSDFVKQYQSSWNTDIDNIQNIINFNTFVQKYSELFGKWALTCSSNRESQISNEMWFKGIIGEYFYIENIDDLMKQVWSNNGKNYAFDCVVPASFYRLTQKTRIEFGEDFGVDAIGINRNNEVSVAQIKNWNIFSNKLITYGDVVSNMFTDGVCRKWIEFDQNESMFVFWLGKIKNISKPLNNLNCPLYNKVKYFGFDDLNIIHNGYPQFFATHNHFKCSLKNIINYTVNCDTTILTKIDTL